MNRKLGGEHSRAARVVRERISLFFVGLIWDAIVTLDIIVTSQHLAWAAAVTTAVLTLVSFTVYPRIVKSDGLKWGNLLTLTVGSAIGTYFMVQYFTGK